MAQRLENKIALISGAASGIGLATARLFAAEGARVALVDVNRAGLERAAIEIGASARAIPADVASDADARRAIADCVAAFGGLTTLVNNAGIRMHTRLAETEPESWRRILDVNLMGAVHLSRAALEHLRRAKGAAIVNVSSVYGLIGRAGMGQYDTTKAALVSLTRTLAAEEAEHGIRANAVCPGGTLTPYNLGRATAQTGKGAAELLAERGKAGVPLGRWAEAHEIAWPILWLASDEASFITGVALPIDGGSSAV